MAQDQTTRNAEIADELPPEMREAAFRGLPQAHIDHFRRHGEEVDIAEGEALFEAGGGQDAFYVILSGKVEITDPAEDGALMGVADDTAFLGELGMLMGQAAFLDCRASEPTRALRVPVSALKDTIDRVPEIADIVVSAFSARREVLIRSGGANLTIVGPEQHAAVTRAREFASRNRIPHRWLAPESDAGRALVGRLDLKPDELNVVVFGDRVVERPDNPGIAWALGMHLELEDGAMADLAVIGAGPGGLAAAVYGASEGLDTVVIEDTAIGGQAGTSSRIENYMGFPTGISGSDLAYRGQVQSVKFGARFAAPRTVRSLHKADDGFRLRLCNGNDICARALVVATGVQYRKLPLDRLGDFEGAGIYYAATDLEARFCRNTEAVIVGGGNSAGQAAMFLSRHARHVHLVVRSADLAASMSSYLSTRLDADPKITLHFETEVTALHGETSLDAVTLTNTATGEERRQETRALFIMIGAAPRTEWLAEFCELDEKGFVKTGPEHGGRTTFETSCPGIFAIGDVRAGSVKRVASAVGEGSVVVSAVHEVLNGEEGGRG